MNFHTKINHFAYFWLLVLAGWLLAFSAHCADKETEFNEKIVTPELIQQLQTGGFVIYMRHGNTDNSRPDQAPKVDLNDCSTQRVLDQKGVAVTKRVGNYVRAARIPIGDVFASPMCRAKNSAENAFGHYQLDNKLMYTGTMTSAEKKPVIANTRRLISEPQPLGTNRVLVAHAPNMMDLINYFPEEATLVIFKPQGNSQFEYLGSIRPGDWPALLEQLK
ncbi:hypothetical protein J3998_02835 [Thiomicrorhabdus sp. 6S2-11]|uniref:Histidine phosphatase family protein n=1 Tax=Thiomicrorhabdus marina TaxID=2818442 RepID=A0ABS3Q3H8_9GAMM|nr:hypothetical protein [Thiomicrorhabdus marina]MBO1926499.1 hypothetical protein [Thiomicrorhabdus marina]